MDINKMLREARQKKLSGRDIVTSPEFIEFSRKQMSTMLKKQVSLDIQVDLSPEAPVAFTTGSYVFMNAANPVSEFYVDPVSQVLAFCGIRFHETAHILYLDFDGEKKALDTIFSGKFYGAEPETETLEEDDALEELKDAMKAYPAIFKKVYAEISNIISDPHDEAKIIDRYGGFVEECLDFSTCSLMTTCPSVEQQERNVKAGKLTELQMMFNLMLQYIRWGSVHFVNEKTEEKSAYLNDIYDLSKEIFVAKSTDKTEEKFSVMNRMVLKFWPYLKKELENQQNNSGNNGQQNQNPQSGGQNQQNNQQNQSQQPLTEQQIQNIMNQLSQAAKEAGTSQQASGKSSKEAKAAQKPQQSGQSQQSQQPQPQQSRKKPDMNKQASESAKAVIQEIQSNVQNRLAQEKVEAEIARALNSELSVPSESSTHKGIQVTVKRSLGVNQSDVSDYKAKMRDLAPYSRKLQKEMKDYFRNLSMDDKRHGLHAGKFEARNAYKLDKRTFYKKKDPEIPTMAIAVVIDTSGSMGGERLAAAKKAAMLLCDFSDGLDIPTFVVGHSAIGDREVEMTVVADFDKVTNNDKYRISKLTAHGCNRDGLVLEKVIARLEKRPEEIKMCFIISDGTPNHNSYGGEEAYKDISRIVSLARRHGVEVFAAAVGEDKKQIQEIYSGNRFLDISDLSRLPQLMLKIVKKRFY